MKRVVKVKLVGGPETDQLLRDTLLRCNQAANFVSTVAFERNIRYGRDLREVTYGRVKLIVPGAQAAQMAIRKVADAGRAFRANLRAGHYGKPGTQRRAQAESKPVRFRPGSAQPYDDRNLSWNHETRHVSIWVADTGDGTPGRIKIPYTGRGLDLDTLAKWRQGETDLVCRNTVFYLYATCEIPEPDLITPQRWLGVDLGVVKIAATADQLGNPGQDWSGGAITQTRIRNQHLRARLQHKGTKSAKRLLKKRSGKEHRFVTDTNHVIAKQIVAEAKRTNSGIAIETLTGIRERARHRKPQRATLHSWAFAQLGNFLTYKAQAAGVPLVQVDPAWTSQTCSACGQRDKRSRPDQATYHCTTCGASLNADTNAAINIARRGQQTWAVSHATRNAA